MVASDNWYGIFGNQDPNSNVPVIPQMFIGRLPANDATALQDMVAKVVKYEQFDAGQAWRQRIVLDADDAFSGDSFFGGGGPAVSGYCHEYAEENFHGLSDAVNAIITSP